MQKGFSHCCRSSKNFGTEIIFLCDNMAVGLVYGKGRCASRDFKVFTVLRRVLAYSLASGVLLRVRWIPSELNTADPGSRLYEQGPAKRVPPGLRHL